MIHLHNHSDRSSPFDGYSKINEIILRTQELGANAVALTDHGTLSGIYEFYIQCNKASIKPILGCEFYFTPDVSIKDRKEIYHMVLLAKNQQGYYNLKKLDSLASENRYYKPRIDLNLLTQYSNGLICLSACLASIVNTENGEYWAKTFKNLFKSDFYLELQPNSQLEQHIYNEKLIELAQNLDIPLVVTNDSHYSVVEDAKYHRLWVNTRDKKKKVKSGDDEGTGYYSTDEYYMMSQDEIYKLLYSQGIDDSIIREAFNNTHLIADQCNVSIENTGNHYPVFPCDNALARIKEICAEGWVKKIIDKIPEAQLSEYQQRLEYEISIIQTNGYLDYMLIIHDIVHECKKRNILVGPGRGSAVGSLVCYLMDITKLDPIKFDLYFERFMNPSRVTPPDIDLDFEDIRRDEVIQYIRDKYGYVCNVRTFSEIGVRGAIQWAGKALDMSPWLTDTISSSAESFDDIKDYPDLIDVARHFYGRLDKFGCHASAVLVFPDDPDKYCPMEIQGNNKVASFDYHHLEEIGLLKIDILGLKNLSVISKTLQLIGKSIDIYDIPLDLPEVYKLYATGMTDALFQCESPGMKHLGKECRVGCFEELVALVALYRPGPLDSKMCDNFIKGKQGGDVEYPHLVLEPILRHTYATIVYQEQVMSIVQVMAGMSLAEADIFRKTIGRKEEEKLIPAVNEFIERSVANGYELHLVQEIARQIKACGRYIFNKSHAAAYAFISYITAYLKVYFPLQYMCCVLNNEIGNLENIARYIKECKRMGIKILPPDIRYSKMNFAIEDQGIRYGFHAMKGIGDKCIYNANTFDEFIYKNNHLSISILATIIKAGAVQNEPASVLLSSLAWQMKHGERIKECQIKIDEFRAKGNEKKVLEWQKKLEQVPGQDTIAVEEMDDAALQKEVLGLYLTKSPMDKYVKWLSSPYTLSYAEFQNVVMFPGKYGRMTSKNIVIGGTVAKMANKDFKAKNGSSFGFCDIETLTGDMIGVTFFGDNWDKAKKVLFEGAIVRIQCTKSSQEKVIGLQVAKLEREIESA